MVRRTFPLRPALSKLPFGFADVALFFGSFLLIYGLAHISRGLFVEFRPPAVQPKISLDPRMLPYYAARSTLRMFLALGASFLFTLAYGYTAAKNKRAEQVMVPLLDILQSIPVLGFLTVTVTGFIALFPGSLFGLELASIFAAFTGQAWNMTFAFYHSMITLPRELDEAATIFHLSKWRRFISLEVPASMIPLVWNAMMSFGGGWFFVAFTESITIAGGQYSLPGIGAYVRRAVDEGDGKALVWASVAMVVIIIVVDQFFWRPMVAWSEKFKLEKSASADVPTSWLLELMREAKVPRVLGRYWRRWLRWFRRINWPKLRFRRAKVEGGKRRHFRYGDQIFGGILGGILVGAMWLGTRFVTQEVALREIGVAFGYGTLTFLRVLVLLAVAAVIWTPVGVWIGFHPKLARVAQPVVQILSSYPSNFLFPAFTVLFLRLGIPINLGSIVLMALGTQWYIMFNSIAGAMAVPTDIREMAANMGLKGWPLWQKVILPAIFPSWVTGAITASGGAWNASILAEVVSWQDRKLVADGLGAYITRASDASDVPRVVLGVSVMCVFVVCVNRFGWRRLYLLAETRYRLG